MNADVFKRIKLQIDFSLDDEENLRELAEESKRLIPQVTDRVFAELGRNRDARAVFTGREVQVDRQRRVFSEWLTNVLNDDQDASYLDKRVRIGASHVRAGVGLHYVIAGMQLVWDQFERAAREAEIPHLEAKLRSFHKLLTLELAVMLGGY